MRVGILSDTHDQLYRTERAVKLLEVAGAEALIHCGDFTTPDIVAACSVLPFYFVFGNNDADSASILQLAAINSGATCLKWSGVVELSGKRIGVAHGHLTSDLKSILGSPLDYLLTGHSHETHDQREGTMRRINPGALYRASVYTVALLDLSNDELKFITVPR
jgi:putative phosphoesterase